MFRVFFGATRDLFDEMLVMVGANVIWAIASLPLFTIGLVASVYGDVMVGLPMLLLSVIPGGPATAGLLAMAERITEGRTVRMGLFFEGVRTYWKQSWIVFGLWMLGFALLLINVQLYPQLGTMLGTFLQVVCAYLLLIWMALLIYIGPLMILQVDKRVSFIARNALIMTMGRPVFTFVTLVLMGIVVVLSIISTLLPLIATASWLVIWSFRATRQQIADADAAREAREAASGEQATAERRGGQVRPRD